MDFQYCPKCEALNPPGATHCEQCKAELPVVPEFAPPPVQTESEADGAGAGGPGTAEPAAEVAAEEPPPADAPPFEAAPEVLAKVAGLEAEIEARPGANALYLQLSQVYMTGGRKDLAIRTLERCVEHDPKNVYMRHRLGQLSGAAAAAPTDAPTSTPVVPHAAGAAAPGTARPRGETARVAMATRPAYHPPPPRRRVSRWTVLGGIAAVLALALGVKLVFFPGPKQVVTGPFSAVAPEWSPTGRHFAFVMLEDKRSRLAVYDVREGAMRPLADIAGSDTSAFAWSPDGQRIAFVASAEEGWGEVVFIADVAGGTTRRLREGNQPAWADGTTLLMWCAAEIGQAHDAAFSEDEDAEFSTVSYGPSQMPGPCRVNAATGEVTRRWTESEHLGFGWGRAVSPILGKVAYERASEEQPAAATPGSVDGEFVEMVDSVAERGAKNVYEGSRDLDRELRARSRQQKREGGQASGHAGDVYVADFEGGTEVRLTTDGLSGSPAWTPDGQRLLFVSDGALWVVNADGSGRQELFRGKLADPPAAQLSRDGRHVFFLAPVEGDAGVARLMTGEEPFDLHVARVGSGEAKRLANRHLFKRRYALSPDGKRIVYEFLAETGSMLQGGSRSELWLMRP